MPAPKEAMDVDPSTFKASTSLDLMKLIDDTNRCRVDCFAEVANYADILTQLIVGGKEESPLLIYTDTYKGSDTKWHTTKLSKCNEI
jgi:hypothetical protein